jgi:hypothetical protein
MQIKRHNLYQWTFISIAVDKSEINVVQMWD